MFVNVEITKTRRSTTFQCILFLFHPRTILEERFYSYVNDRGLWMIQLLRKKKFTSDLHRYFAKRAFTIAILLPV